MTALLALLLAVAGLRAAPAAAACCEADCAQPCCARDAGHASVVPVLPCCRASALREAAPHPAPTLLDGDHGVAAAPALATAGALAIVVAPAIVARAMDLPRLRAPPLYRRHCALLL